MAVPCCIPTNNKWVLSHILLSISCCQCFGYSSMCVVVSQCCLNLHFLMIYDGKHLFTCLLVFCISSLVKFLLRYFVHFLFELFFLLLLSFKSYFYILDNNLISIGSSGGFHSQKTMIYSIVVVADTCLMTWIF